MQLYPHISADADVLAGHPVIEGTSVPVSMVISAVAAGKSLNDVANEHGVTVDAVRAALEYAARRVSEPAALAADANGEHEANPTTETPTAVDDEALRLGLDPNSLSSLGRQLLGLRMRGIAAGDQPITTWDALDAEIAERRGGAYPDDNA